MDAFAVSLCKGMAMKHPGLRPMLIIGLWFGIFQAVMPVIGYLLGSSMYDLIKDYDHWIAIGLLLALTVTDLVLAIIGTPEAQLALRVTIVLTVLVPIILYFFVLMLKKRKG